MFTFQLPVGLDVRMDAEASRTLAEAGVSAPPVDVERMIAESGGRIEVFQDPLRMTSAPEAIPTHAGWIARVPDYHLTERRRFLLAGAIGRRRLHHCDAAEAARRPVYPDPEKLMHWQACAFAFSLLLPATKVRAAAARLPGAARAREVARIFQVSEGHAAARLRRLDLIPLGARAR